MTRNNEITFNRGIRSEKYIERGKEKIHNHARYSLKASEIEGFMQKAYSGRHGTFEAIIDAFYFGVEAGCRLTEKQYH